MAVPRLSSPILAPLILEVRLHSGVILGLVDLDVGPTITCIDDR